MTIAFIDDALSYNSFDSAWCVLQELSVVLLDLEGTITENSLYLLMVKAFLGEDSIGESFNLILMELHCFPCFLGALVNDPYHFLVDLCRSFFAINAMSIGINWRVVGEGVTHAEASDHLPCDSAYFLQII